MQAIGRGTQISGRYQFVDPVTSEIAGIDTWIATDRVLEREVRVHLLQKGRTAPALDAARRAALIKDERLIRVIDAGEFGDTPYVITAAPRGQSLQSLITAQKVLPAEQARALIGEAAEAIEAARRRGVYHLVLRPTNIYRTPDSKVLLAGLGLEGSILGLDTAPPLVTARTDAMGLVANLYYALTGLWPSTLPPGVTVEDLEQAPIISGSPIPPAELEAGIPNDLDTLCSVTFGPNNDGPHSAAELSRELAPWPQISAVDPIIMAPEPPPVFEPIPVHTAPSPVPQRESIKKRVDPPPAPPSVERKPTGVRAPAPSPRVSSFPGRTPSASFPFPAAGAAASGPAPLSGARGKSAGSSGRQPRSSGRGAAPFNPTPYVLVFVALTVVVAVVIAVQSLLAPPKPREPGQENPLITAEPVEPAEPEPTPTPTPEPEETAEPEVPAKPIYIDTAEALDPDGPGQHPELQHLAIDGDVETFWTSQWFVDPTIPGRSGIGLGITLEERSKFSSVTLTIDGEGGHIEIRDTSTSDPSGGELLAEGAADGVTTFEFDEVELERFVIWTTELPQASDGNNRIAISDVQVE